MEVPYARNAGGQSATICLINEHFRWIVQFKTQSGESNGEGASIVRGKSSRRLIGLAVPGGDPQDETAVTPWAKAICLEPDRRLPPRVGR